ncbi:hypothetical protein AURDEDRAFT_177644 [Auricularia subglabra TFB-10046 SS5]|uniref:WD40 repeat-like protein n=1 Tax=Auricularia subglabra (strain TFB-10046 / SS5) TaxID=717982 RepID=J0D3L8_AURST|nr:hypothetical protein AURDEDRAFT_177644 [Auricularia subglabra TFB-10046 SS5]
MPAKSLAYTSSHTLVHAGHRRVASLAVSPDGRYIVAYHEGDDTSITLWRLSSGRVVYSVTSPFQFLSVLWPVHAVGATFLGLNGIILVFPPSKPNHVKTAIIQLGVDIILAADFCAVDAHDTFPPDARLLAAASPTRVDILLVSSDGEQYRHYKRFNHAERAEPVAITWGEAYGATLRPLWVAYRDGSVM